MVILVSEETGVISLIALEEKKNRKDLSEVFHGKLQLPGNFMALFVPSVDMVSGYGRESARSCAFSPSSNIRTFPVLNYCFLILQELGEVFF